VLEVLLVDDELPTRELLEQFCRSRNLPVTTASDGRAAITALERTPTRFSIVLTDISMPGADGFEVLKTARSRNRSCYVVMITGYATLDSALRAVREGAYDYLAKPFSIGQLDVMLARIRDRIALERENRDLRRRLGERAPSVPPAPPAPAPMLYSALAPPLTLTPARLHTLPPAPVADANSRDLARRVNTMEERLERIEEMLKMALTPTR
jgi:CheY-like chemotaxis protein